MKRLLIAALALLTIASTDPVADTRAILAGTVTTKNIKSAYLNGSRDGTAAFQGALSAYKGVRAAEPPLTVKCADGTLVKAPGACPVAIPPAPIPTPAPTPVPTPTLATYDTSIGTGVDANGYAILPLRAGAHRYFVSSAVGSNANGCVAAQASTKPLASIATAKACMVNGNGDQMLIAEGTTYVETLPNLDFLAGFSPQYPTVVQSYDPADPLNESKYGHAANGRRPVVNTAGVVQNIACCTNTPTNYIAIRGFDMNPGNKPDMELRFIGPNNYVLVENNILRFTAVDFDSSRPAIHHVIRKNSQYGSWSATGHAQGSYDNNTAQGLVYEDNIFWHSGWKMDVSRDEAPNSGGADIFKHAIYQQNLSMNAIVRRNIFVDPSATGNQARGGGLITENVYIDNPIATAGGGGTNYSTISPTGVDFEISYNAIIGNAWITSALPRGFAIVTSNGRPGSSVHHNLIVRNINPADYNTYAFNTSADWNVPSYADYHDNRVWKWSTPGKSYIAGGSYPTQIHSTFENNIWDDPTSGSNVNNAGLTLPNPLTTAQLFAALCNSDKATCMAKMVETPELGWAPKARALLFTGYGMTP